MTTINKTRRKPDIEALIKIRDELLIELQKLPHKERDYSAYRKAYMKVKYYTDEDEINRQREHTCKRIKEIYNDEVKHNAYKDYMRAYQRKRAKQRRAQQVGEQVAVSAF